MKFLSEMQNNNAFINEAIVDQYVTADLGKGNLINFSSIRSIHKAFTPRAFSVKYVLEGAETYIVNNNRYTINPGEYLLVNPSCSCEVQISSSKQVKGICIDVSNTLLADVANVLHSPEMLDNEGIGDFMLSDRFFESSYDVKSTAAGGFLKKSESGIVSDPSVIGIFTEEFYIQLAEKLILDQLQLVGKLAAIKSVKYATKKELLRRLLIGKAYIDD